MKKTLRQRLIYSSFLLPARLGLVFELPMAELVDLMQMAVFHETKRRGLKMKEVSQLLDISMRKVSLLSQRLRRNFSDVEKDIELPRRIEFMLWVEPLSEARILQVMREDAPDDIMGALDQLENEGRVTTTEKEGQRIFEVSKHEFRLVSKKWVSRIDGVNNLLSNVANTIDARFFHEDPRAFARTISFRVRDEDIEELDILYRDVIWKKLTELDQRAHEDDDSTTIDLSILWAPYEFIQQKLEEKHKEE